jgi:Sodium/hydrogen exchanger family
MPDVSFTNLLMVAAVAVLAPLIVGFAPRLRVPAVVLEIIGGIIIGPSGLGWVHVDLPVQILALFGLAFLLFLAGLASGHRCAGRERPADDVAAVASVRAALAPARRGNRAAVGSGGIEPRPARAPLGGPARWSPRAARVAERVAPLTRWAKAMMMLQSAVSVAAVALVVARAVNILG